MPSSFHLRHTVILLPLVAVLLFLMVKLPFPIATFGRMDSWFIATARAMQQKSPLNSAPPLADIVQVASGGNHSCALTSAGAVFCWGSNDYGQLGDSTNLLRMAPTAVVGLSSGVTTISAGGAHTCAATNNGLFCWGRNNNGQVGDGSRTDRNTPVAIDGLGSGITVLAAGTNHTCAATASTVRCWGDNLWGQLGDGTATDRTTPVLVTNLSGNVAELVAGEGHTCARSGGVAVRCWGHNQMGQLGDGTTIGRTTPVLVTNLSGDITDLAAGANYTCAVTGQNSPVCWGENEQGQLGDGTTTNRSTPIAVSGLPGETVALATGLAHSCAIVDMTQKALYCWGFNQDGQLGNATTENRLNPVQVSTFGQDTMMVSLGANHSCALRGRTGEATALYCWGANYYGQLGYGAPTSLSPQSTVALDNVAALTAGRDHSCALNNAGAVYCWGNNEHGQLGDGTRTRRAAPVPVNTLAGGVIAVRAGDRHTCALLTGGALRCWGSNQWGQIGDGTTIDRLTPVSVGNFTGGVTALHVGYDYSCILTDAAMTYCWGWNGYGQVGDGTREHRALPVTVSNVSGEPIALAGGNSHVCLLTKLATANAVSCWGHNLYGQLGDGTRTDHITPAPVHGLAGDVETIIAKGHHTCAIAHSEKTLRCWGANGTGQLGDGTDIVRTTPVAVAGLPATVASSIAGYFHTCASTTASALFCWGDNSSGQLGDGTLINRLTPTRISDLSGDVVALAAGYAHTCALSQESTADRVVHCWGSNLFGQLGNDAAWRTAPMLVIDPNAAPEPTPVPPPPRRRHPIQTEIPLKMMIYANRAMRSLPMVQSKSTPFIRPVMPIGAHSRRRPIQFIVSLLTYRPIHP